MHRKLKYKDVHVKMIVHEYYMWVEMVNSSESVGIDASRVEDEKYDFRGLIRGGKHIGCLYLSF